jgi:hypothetical protein
MNSRHLVWLTLIAAIIILFSINYTLLVVLPTAHEHPREQLKMTEWILPSGPETFGRDPYESPVIVYDNENKSIWQVQDIDRWNKAIFVGDHINSNLSSPENLWYSPDIAIEGNNISLDFFVWNGAGYNCNSAFLNLTTEYEDLNNVSGSPEGEIQPGIPSRLNIRNLSEGESTEVRVTTSLPQPGLDKILRLTITLMAPDIITSENGTTHVYDRDSLPRGTAVFVIKSRDAADFIPAPTIRAY